MNLVLVKKRVGMSSLLGKYIHDYVMQEDAKRKEAAEIASHLTQYDVKTGGFTIYRMAHDSGVSDPVLRRIIENEHYEPDNSTLLKLAKYLGVDVHYLFDLVLGVSPEERERAYEESKQASQLGEANRELFDQVLMNIIGGGKGELNSPVQSNDIAILLLQEIQQLRHDIALLRGKLEQ